MKHQRGGTVLGFILGVLVGLGAALAVAVYVTKVPIPFVNKSQSRTPEQDAAETRKNKDWDPNVPLYGKNPAAKASDAAASGAVGEAAAAAAAAAAPEADKAAAKSGVKADAKPDAKPAAAKPDAKPLAPKPEARPAASADPLGDLARAKSGGVEPFAYYVQVGAYRQPEEAETQRAKLTMMGVEARVSEREQSGRMVYRVRVGPFEQREEAEKTRDKLDGAGLDTTMVKVQR